MRDRMHAARTLGLGTMVLVSSAASAATPANIKMDEEIPVGPASNIVLVPTGKAVHRLVVWTDETKGFSVVRKGRPDYKMVPGWKNTLQLRQVVGDAADSLYVYYSETSAVTTSTMLGKLLPDNTVGFYKKLVLQDGATIVADEAGGLYIAAHAPFASGGEFFWDRTKFTIYRLSPTGDIAWQQGDPDEIFPDTVAARGAHVAVTPGGVVAAYVVPDAAKKEVPVITARAADGTSRFRLVGVKGPAAKGKGAPGTVGTHAVEGRPAWVGTASDGSTLATIVNVYDNSRPITIVRFDAAGTQTAAFHCKGWTTALVNHEMLCAAPTPDGHAATRYGIKDGKFTALGTLDWQAAPGWNGGAPQPLPGGLWLAVAVSTEKSPGTGGLLLYSPEGTLLSSTMFPHAMPFAGLAATANAWAATLHQANGIAWSDLRGTYTPGKADVQAAPKAGKAGSVPMKPQ